MISLILWALSAPAASWVVFSWYCLLCDYLIARKVGLPLRIIPISHENRLWMAIDPISIPFLKKLPFGNGTFTQFNWRGWEFADKYRAHEEMDTYSWS